MKKSFIKYWIKFLIEKRILQGGPQSLSKPNDVLF